MHRRQVVCRSESNFGTAKEEYKISTKKFLSMSFLDAWLNFQRVSSIFSVYFYKIRHLCSVTDSFEPQQKFSGPGSLEPTEQNRVWFRSKGKIFFLSWEHGEQRASSGSRALGATGCGRGCFPGIPSAGREQGSGGWARLRSSRSRSQSPRSLSAHSPPLPSWTEVWSVSPHTARPAEVPARPFCTRNSGLKCGVQVLCTRPSMSRWN